MSDIAFSVIVNNNGIDDIVFKTIMLKGDKGNSVDHVEKTSTSGLVDTYTIYLTDGTIGGTFTVTNGSPVNIDDTVTAIDKTWSSSKLSGMIKSIDDNVVNADKLWSSQKINSMLTQTGTIEDVAIASFSDGADDVPLSELIVDIEAWQEGSGEPSPNNERAIHGWNKCNLSRFGMNFLNLENSEQGGIDASGVEIISTFSWRANALIRIIPGVQYTLSVDVSDTYIARLYFYDSNGNFISPRYAGNNTITATAPSNAKYCKWVFYTNADTTLAIIRASQPQLEMGATRTTYHTYMGDTATIEFGQTIFGGKLNILTGLMTVTHAIDDFGNLNWNRTTSYSNPVFYSNIISKATKSIQLMCSKYNFVGSFSSASAFSSSADQSLGNCSANEQIYVRDDTYSDASSFKTATAGTKVLFELAEPQTIQLSPVEVRTLLNANNIYADTGNVEKLVYFKTGSEAVAKLIEAYMRAQPEE